jgi:hypothetical protein
MFDQGSGPSAAQFRVGVAEPSVLSGEHERRPSEVGRVHEDQEEHPLGGIDQVGQE